MNFTILEIEPIQLYFISVGAGLLSLVIFYYLIKNAVKNGIIDAQKEVGNKSMLNSEPEKTLNTKQVELQKKYDRGEIGFEEYKTEWNK